MALYSCDTSIFIEAWTRHYRRATFPNVWKKMEELIEDGTFIASEEVLGELKKKVDDLYGWARKHRKMFVPVDEPIQIEVKALLKAHRRLVDSKKGRSGTDPFVIALAKLRSATVLTEEKSALKPGMSIGTLNSPRIPDVCGALGIPCVTLADFFQQKGYVLG